MKKILILVSLILPVVISGCITQPPTTTTTAGVLIKSFSPETDEIEPGLSIVLPLIVKNIGGLKAENINIELMGLTDEWTINGAIPALALEREEAIDDLLPPDPERGLTEGQEGYYAWTLEPPEKEVTLTYDMSVRVYYDYKTTSESLFRAISLEYYKTLSPEEKEKKDWGVRTTTSTNGPFLITVKSPQPIVTTSDPTSPIWFEFQKVGEGRAYKKTDEVLAKPDVINTLDKILVTVSGVESCTGTEVSENTYEVSLINGISGRLYCKIRFTSAPTTYTDKSVSLSANYRYYMDAYASITSLKKVVV